MKKPTVWCVIGPSGSGKTHLSKILAADPEWNVVCSYTTRPMRDGEVNGVDHWFICERQYMAIKAASDSSREYRRRKEERHGMTSRYWMDNEMLAYVNFGGYHYFTCHHQIEDEKLNLYVIDEDGYREMVQRFGELYDLHVLYVTAGEDVLLGRGISRERIARDAQRTALDHYELQIQNTGSLEYFESSVLEFSRVAKEMKV